MAEIQQQTPPHIVLLSSPGMGHLIPLAEFAKRLVFQHHFSVTLMIPTVGLPSKAQKWVVESLPSSINSIFLSPITFEELSGTNEVIEILISSTMSRCLPLVHEKIKSIMQSERVVALVVDDFGVEMIDVAKEFNLPLYIFSSSNAMALCFMLESTKLDAMYSCSFGDVVEPIKLPGCVPILGRDLVDTMHDKGTESYEWQLRHSKLFKLAEGILVNSFVDLEPGVLKALKELDSPPVYPIGPLIKDEAHGPEHDESGCLKWLDQQPNGSVLFISFGSCGTLSTEQLSEMAFGLELSGQRFLWVVRSPNDKSANATYLSVKSIDDPFDFLPNSFLERTKGLGLLVPFWAPQIQILSHRSIGGFLTHCGWNSVLESVVHGVPLIGWPLFAEQKLNEVMLVDDVKVALRPEVDQNGLIGRAEVARVVKCLMKGEEGKELQNRMNILKIAAAEVLRENGSSSKSLADVALKWKMHDSTTEM